MPQELREQVPVIQEVLAAMDIEIVTKEGYEADDILGIHIRRSCAVLLHWTDPVRRKKPGSEYCVRPVIRFYHS